MVRSASIDKNGIKKGEWSKEEDDKLRAYIDRYGVWNWRQLPQFAGLSRCGKSCRLRWKNYLQPNVKRGNYTKEEEDLIFNLHNQLGKKWSVIATKLPGRTDNEIKNFWHTHLKKRTEAQNLTLPSNQKKKIKSISKEEIDQISSSESDHEKQQIISPNLSQGLANSPNESCCSEVSQSYSDAPSTDLFNWVQKNADNTKSYQTSCDGSNLSQELKPEDHDFPHGSSSSEMSFIRSDHVSDLMALFGEDNSITPTSYQGLDDFWSESSFETDNYMMNSYRQEQAILVDIHGLVYPTSPTIEEVFLWS